MAYGIKWQQMAMEDQIRLGPEIDGRFGHTLAANALVMAAIVLPFYPGARLIRITDRQPSLGDEYCIEHGGEAFPLRGLDEIQPLCDRRFTPAPTAENAADYFRFAHFFTSRGKKYPVVESAADVHLLAKRTPAEQKVPEVIRPVETKITDDEAIYICAYTVEYGIGVLNEDTYRLTPCKPLTLLSSRNTGVVLPNPWSVRTFLYVGDTAMDPESG